MEHPTPQPFHYAGFWRRHAAYGIDFTLVLFLTILVSSLLGSFAHAQSAADIEALKTIGWLPANTDASATLAAMQQAGMSFALPDLSRVLFEIFVSIATSAIYNIYFVSGSWQATPGKHWLRMKVVMLDGSRPTLLQSTLRHLASGVSMAIFGLGYITMALNREKAALHDLMVGSRVILRPTH